MIIWPSPLNNAMFYDFDLSVFRHVFIHLQGYSSRMRLEHVVSTFNKWVKLTIVKDFNQFSTISVYHYWTLQLDISFQTSVVNCFNNGLCRFIYWYAKVKRHTYCVKAVAYLLSLLTESSFSKIVFFSWQRKYSIIMSPHAVPWWR